MKIKILFFLLLLSVTLFSQDTVFDNGLYKVEFNKKYRVATKITYTLYKGGGDCSRDGMNFKSYDFTSNNKEYKKSGFDRGHLIPAEDFAFDCEKERKTFEYYNVVPQTHKFNAGVIKTYEEKIRLLSQSDSIKIDIINVIDSSSYIGKMTYKVKYEYKVVRSLTTHEVLLCVKFDYHKESAEEIHINQAQYELRRKL